jgi:glycosyltransferase involved in cell wall biosynthesis
MKITSSPLVSICIPTYNREKIVQKTIESALAQTYPNIEILVVDNASQDNIESVIENYQEKKIKFYRNDRNLGIFGNFNRCIELSNGKYIHILHSDDYIDSNFIKTCVGFMELNPNVKMTWSSAWLVSKDKKTKVGISDHNIIFTAPDGFKKILELGNPIVCPSVIMRREVYDTLGLYSCEFPYAGDIYYWLKISRCIDIAFIANATLFYNIGEHSESYNYLKKTQYGYFDLINVFTKTITDLGEQINDYRNELNFYMGQHLYNSIELLMYPNSKTKLINKFKLIEFSLQLWILIKCDSLRLLIKKFYFLLYIFTVFFSLFLPMGVQCLRNLLPIKNIKHYLQFWHHSDGI